MNMRVLRQNHPQDDPNGEGFDYAEEFKKLDLEAVKKDIFDVMTTSQDWWLVVLVLCSSAPKILCCLPC